MITKNKKEYEQTNNIESIRISSIEKTDDVLTDRAGLLLLYLSHIGIYPLIEGYFGSMRKSKKRDTDKNIFKQPVKRIRKECREDVPIIIRADAGFSLTKRTLKHLKG